MDKFVIEINTWRQYAAGRLNCDETGDCKTVTFDGKTYSRISSQAKKRAIRDNLNKNYLKPGEAKSYQTRDIKDVICDSFNKLYADVEWISECLNVISEALVEGVIETGLKENANGMKITNQIIGVGENDTDDIAKAFMEIIKTKEDLDVFIKEYKALLLNKEKKKKTNVPTPLITSVANKAKKMAETRRFLPEQAMFGRMSTSKSMPSIESSFSMNHSYSLGEATNNNDFYIATDTYSKDAEDTDNTGAGYLDSKNFESHIYYGAAQINCTNYYNNRMRGVTDEQEKEAIKKDIVEHVVNTVYETITSSPYSGQHSFFTNPEPSDVIIKIRTRGNTITADASNFRYMNLQELQKVSDEDAERYIPVKLTEEQICEKAVADYMNGKSDRKVDFNGCFYLGQRNNIAKDAGYNIKNSMDDLLSSIKDKVSEAVGV